MTVYAESRLRQDVLDVARSLVPSLVARGAEAVVLTGSHARGTGHRHSDVDVVPLGIGPPRTLVRRSALLIAISWRTADRIRERLHDPAEVGTAVPTAREAVILHDPDQIASAIQRDAKAWTWDVVEERCDAWVAEETTRLAEEVQKLVAALENGWHYPAAMQRSILALAVGPILGVHHRLLYGREANLFELLALVIGPRWARSQACALGLGDEGHHEACIATLDLYLQLADEVEQLLDSRQHRVVAHACLLAESAQ